MSTKIEWCSETWNPFYGCSHASPGCDNCYAERFSKRINGAHPSKCPSAVTKWDGAISELDPNKLNYPLTRWASHPRIIFVSSMSDFFHPNVPDHYRLKMLSVMRSIVNPVHPHIYIILTKRPDFALDFFAMHKPALTPNIWIGVSCETTEATWYRVPLLKALKFPGKKIISFEPLLSSIDATPSIADDIDWIICGAETGPKARHMDPIWAVRLAESASACNIPFFFKKFSKYGPKPTPEEIDLLYRREFPLPNSELPIYAHTSAGGRVNVQPKISYTLK